MSCSIDAIHEQSPKFEVVHETNKAHFRKLLPNRFGGFKPHWGASLTKFILFCVTLNKDWFVSN